MKKCALHLYALLLWLGLHHQAVAQTSVVPLFRDNERVCFVGNSITQSGGYHHYIYLYHVTRFPDERVTFVNCGVGGDVASKILARMEEDILVNDPDHLVLMVGMNDANRPLYAPENSGDTAVERAKTVTLETYKAGTSEIVRRFKMHTPNVILIKPSIYDQTAQIPTENLYGVNDALYAFSKHLEQLAVAHQTRLVDFWSVLNDLNLREQRKDPTFTIIGEDRIHPRVTGHMVMAYQFLKDMQAPVYVSKMVISRTERVSNEESINCSIKNLKRGRDHITFKCREGSLPFPLPAGAEHAFSLVPFNEDLNQEVLQIAGLKKGSYDLRIDGSRVGTYTADDLEAGINLATNENTPQYRQSAKVMDECVKIKQLQAKLRLLKRVEYVEFKQNELALGMDSVARILGHRLTDRYINDRYDFNKKLFADYLIIKPQADQIKEAIRAEERLLYRINGSLEHTYEIRKADTGK